MVQKSSPFKSSSPSLPLNDSMQPSSHGEAGAMNSVVTRGLAATRVPPSRRARFRVWADVLADAPLQEESRDCGGRCEWANGWSRPAGDQPHIGPSLAVAPLTAERRTAVEDLARRALLLYCVIAGRLRREWILPPKGSLCFSTTSRARRISGAAGGGRVRHRVVIHKTVPEYRRCFFDLLRKRLVCRSSSFRAIPMRPRRLVPQADRRASSLRRASSNEVVAAIGSV